MDLDLMLPMLYHKDTSQAFQALKELEQCSDHSNALYPHVSEFADMVGSETYVIRVRGFRLFCKQARWDVDGVVTTRLKETLTILHDPKPTAVRQALAALQDVARYKPDLHDMLREQVAAINVFQYKDTMSPLILKDIQALLAAMES